MKLQILIALCLQNVYAESKWRPEYPTATHRLTNWPRDAPNEIPIGRIRNKIPDPPDHTKLIPMARYVLHNSGEKKFKIFVYFITLILCTI